MDWNEAIEDERQAMKRFAARLLSFAVIAECLVRLPWPVRCFVMWLLHRAECVMLGVIYDDIEMFGRAGLRLLEKGPTQGSRRPDCIRLGQRFRTMARLFNRVAARVARLGRKRCDPHHGHISRYEAAMSRLRQLAQLLASAIGAIGSSAMGWTALNERVETTAESWNSS